MAALTPPQLYRTVLRQFVQNVTPQLKMHLFYENSPVLFAAFQSIQIRAKRSATINSHLRLIFEAGRNFKAGSPEMFKLSRDADNMVVYLKSHRLHKELVERYNPTNVLSGQERARMSAAMVGLNMPAPFAEGEEPTMEGEKSKLRRAEKAAAAAASGAESL